MQGFWKFVSLILGLLGFLITGGLLLLRGEAFHIAVIRAIISFVALYAVQNLLGGILFAVLSDQRSDSSGTGEVQRNDSRVPGS